MSKFTNIIETEYCELLQDLLILLDEWKRIHAITSQETGYSLFTEDIPTAVKHRKVLPNVDSAKKVVYLAIEQASSISSMPIRNWKTTLNRFMIEFEDRI